MPAEMVLVVVLAVVVPSSDAAAAIIFSSTLSTFIQLRPHVPCINNFGLYIFKNYNSDIEYSLSI